MKEYYFEFRTLSESATIKSNCNSITFINSSLIDTPQVNGIPMIPGQVISLSGNENEIDKTIGYAVVLPTPNDPNTFFIITKVYK